ncbi:hypothetical protein ACFWZW_08035 [Microbacterium enclense]|uniref:hypothetical protein n=1 Tax=Microbacterium enclense TaxID=993073 RepID=UPI0036DAA57B
MTTNVFTWGQPSRLRRSTFVPSPAEATAQRLSTALVVAAAVTSVAGLAVLAPLVF